MNNLPRLYEPELKNTEEKRQLLWDIYIDSYPWHGTQEAGYYDYPSFDQEVIRWANDEFYIQHLLARLYLDSVGDV